MKPLYIFDIDGTVADLTHRLHLIKCDSPDWEAFHYQCKYDKPIRPVLKTCLGLWITNSVWFFTGRMDYVRNETRSWLMEWTGREPVIEMRRSGDYRPDYEVKQEMLDNMLEEDRDRLVAVFDDRKQVVDMWRRNGITCFQVKDGDY